MEKMTHDYIRQVIPAEISEKGGAHLRLVGGKTIPLETSIKEAKAAGYVLGDEELVKRQFEGLVKCMRDGTEADGMARQIGGWVTVYPVFIGLIDLAKGFDPEKNGVRIRMRLLNEIDVDITDWEFRDVTPGRTPFTIDSASTGELVNTVKVGDPIHVNGRPFPPHDALRVDWAVEGTDKSGTIPAEKFTSDATLITIAADALAELASDEYDGKTIVFTVRGNFASAKISAKLKYVAPQPTPIAESEDGITKVMTFVDAETGADRIVTGMNDFVLDGEGLELAEDGGDGVTGVKFFGPGLEDYLDLTEGARNDGSKLIACVGSYVDTLEPGDHECHLGLYLKHGEATDLNVWIDFTLRKE